MREKIPLSGGNNRPQSGGGLEMKTRLPLNNGRKNFLDFYL